MSMCSLQNGDSYYFSTQLTILKSYFPFIKTTVKINCRKAQNKEFSDVDIKSETLNLMNKAYLYFDLTKIADFRAELKR